MTTTTNKKKKVNVQDKLVNKTWRRWSILVRTARNGDEKAQERK